MTPPRTCPVAHQTGAPAADAKGQVTFRRDAAVAYVSLDHPGRMNAITVAMWRALAQTFAAISADRSIRCVVITGAGDHFAAGADIREFPQERSDRRSVAHYHRQVLAPALHAIGNCAQPVVARIRGVCVGGGLEIASQCDLRIAGAGARLGVPINRLGFPMAPEELRGLLDLAGRATTLELLLEGRILDAREAYEKGLLTRVVEDAALDEAVTACVRRILAGAPSAARINKRTVQRLSQPQPLHEDEYHEFFSYAESPDHKEGVRAFLAGEGPSFSGD